MVDQTTGHGGDVEDSGAHVNIAAAPVQLLQAHAQGPILCNTVQREPASLTQRARADNHIGTCTATNSEILISALP